MNKLINNFLLLLLTKEFKIIYLIILKIHGDQQRKIVLKTAFNRKKNQQNMATHHL